MYRNTKVIRGLVTVQSPQDQGSEVLVGGSGAGLELPTRSKEGWMLLAPANHCSTGEPVEREESCRECWGRTHDIGSQVSALPPSFCCSILWKPRYHPLRLCGTRRGLGKRGRMLLQASSPLWPWLCHLPWPRCLDQALTSLLCFPCKQN